MSPTRYRITGGADGRRAHRPAGLPGLCLSLAAATAMAAGMACQQSLPAPPDGDVRTLVFAHGRLSGPPEAFAAMLRDFEARHPGLTVRENVLPASTDQQHQFYAINLEDRSAGFDVVAADIIWIQEFAKAGWIRNVDGLLPPARRADYFPEAIRAATYGGGLYGVPWYMDAGLLYYRRDLLERAGVAAPRTWPELAQAVHAVLDKERDPALAGFVWQGKQYEGLVCVAHEFAWGGGSDLVTGLLQAAQRAEGPEAAAQEAERALAALRDFVTEGISPPSVATADEEAARHLFGTGRAVFMRNWAYAWTILQRDDSPVRGKIGVAPLPSFPGHPSVSVLGGWMLAVPREAPHRRDAEALVEFLTSPDIQSRMAREMGYNPVLRSLYHDAALLQAQPRLRELLPILQAARPRPVTPYYLMLSQVLQPELSAAIVGVKPPDAALVQARRQMAAVLGREAERLQEAL